MSLVFCTCGDVVEVGQRCKCKGKVVPSKSTTEYGYDHKWRTMSERIRRQRPLCEDCEARGKVVPSVECHHVIAIKDDPTRRLDPSNVVALCGECHDARHRTPPPVGIF